MNWSKVIRDLNRNRLELLEPFEQTILRATVEMEWRFMKRLQERGTYQNPTTRLENAKNLCRGAFRITIMLEGD